jgi:hypothetical protein
MNQYSVNVTNPNASKSIVSVLRWGYSAMKGAYAMGAIIAKNFLKKLEMLGER